MTERRSIGRSLGWWARAIQVRLRFILVLAAATVVIGGWDTWRTYWDRWIAPAGRDSALGAVSSNTEYFCPMDPGVHSEWPGKCSVCNMPLVSRAKGDMAALPSGVVARVQLSPARVQLGGIATAVVEFRPLERGIAIPGIGAIEDEKTVFVAGLGGVDRTALVAGQKVSLTSKDGRAAVAGTFIRIESDGWSADRAIIRPDAAGLDVRVGEPIWASWVVPMAECEPFRSMPSDLPPLKPKEPHSLYLCGNHPEIVRFAAGSCPMDGNALMRRDLASYQRIRWWCPLHPEVTAATADSNCDECDGAALVPRVVTYRPKGQVLAVPETAVIDTGARRVVYVESMPGTFDAVEVVLGPRCRMYYPIVSGLEPGQNVAAAGAFLLDAETRLNPSLASSYFGAARPATSPGEAPKARLDFSGLSAADLDLATAQKTCPVTKKPLGSMGSPFKVAIGGRSVFVCCDGCVQTLKDKPEKYLKAESGPAHHP